MPYMYQSDTGVFRSGMGRLVQGEPYKAHPRKDDDGNNIVKDGVVQTEFYAGIAFPKTDPDWIGLKGAMDADCRKEWAGKVNFEHAAFSFKWRDADASRDKAGNLLADKNPATKGCDVLGINRNGSFGLPQMFARAHLLPDGHPEKIGLAPGAKGALVALDVALAEKLLRKGNYVRVFGDRKTNDTPKYPGQYVNLEGIELVGYGDEIITSGGARPDADTMFGDDDSPNAPAVATPAPASAQAPTASPSSAPAPAPYSGHMQAPAPGPQVTPAALAAWPDGKTVEAWTAAGWTLDQLKDSGYVS